MSSVNDMLFNPVKNDQQDERSKSEIKLEYLIKQGFTKENIEMKSDLSKQAIRAISKGLLHAEIFSDTTIRLLCETVMVLIVSKDRKGRSELTELSRMINNQEDNEQQTVLSRLLG